MTLKAHTVAPASIRALVIALVLLGASSLTLAPLSLADKGATGVVKERMDLMETQKDAMKIIGDMAKGRTPFDAATAIAVARKIETTAMEIPDLFPEGTVGHPSEAKPEIWTDWERFTGDAEELAVTARALASALAASPHDWQAEFKQVIEACKSCHKSFRMKDE